MLTESEKKDFCIVLCTIPEEQYAIKVSKNLLRNNLASCISLHQKIHSFYLWKNEIKENFEIQMFIKSKKSLLKEIFSYILKIHPYQIPELLVLPIIDGYIHYLSWIDNCLKV